MDGRKPLEFRSMELSLSPHTATGESLVPTAASATSRADGSAEVRQGLTHVYACVYGPMEPGRAARAPTVRQDRATIQVDIAVAPWGAAERRYRARGDRCVFPSHTGNSWNGPMRSARHSIPWCIRTSFRVRRLT